MNERALLRQMFDAAVATANPSIVVPPNLPDPPVGHTIVVGAGKAAASMAAAVDANWPANRPLTGLVVTRYGYGVGALRRIEVVEASHPVPDAAGQEAARKILDLVKGLGPDDLVLCLISGGGSALLSLPAPGIDLADKQAVNRALLRSGANIHDMNCVRKHLSAIKGGRLAAAAAPARVVSLLISDVPGDDPSVIASGPTVPDASTLAQARAVLTRYAIAAPPAVLAHLNNERSETPKPGDPAFARTLTRLIATPQASLEAAAEVARQAGYLPLILGDALEGEASEVGRVMSGIARQVVLHGQPAPAPCVLISGGETTVTVRGKGRGGRNVEFLLSLAVDLGGLERVYAIAGDTDGVDGAEEVAGAIVAPDTLARAAALGVDAGERLADNDGHGFFAALADQVITGPTLTNVNDFRAILIRA
ncbi:glycerate kinase [uncultured Rhodoblastus sp.]|uniref:glycerate kinase type-2 family protein n=1 Tax=uncultured Rhodoblastus sp. TaxID=543037 RepID=UPI0025F106A0|nr:glycerate kinase [uncultured Rhodoblastus sp.]